MNKRKGILKFNILKVPLKHIIELTSPKTATLQAIRDLLKRSR